MNGKQNKNKAKQKQSKKENKNRLLIAMLHLCLSKQCSKSHLQFNIDHIYELFLVDLLENKHD
jgi:hypothetical protein